MVSINYCGKTAFEVKINSSLLFIKDEIKEHLELYDDDYYLIKNGKRFTDSHVLEECIIHVTPKLIGGKGGFGSMLRAIGAQIEKTTNREACRDLSGRRLRDINEEKRLKTWIAQQVEREKEAEDRREKKLQRLCQKPKHEFKDESYEKERSVLTEKVEDALEQGLKASTSTNVKRKHTEEKTKTKKKKMWLGSEDELSSSSDMDSDDDGSSDCKKRENDSSEDSNSKPEPKESSIKTKSDAVEKELKEENSCENKELEVEQKDDTKIKIEQKDDTEITKSIKGKEEVNSN